MAQFDLKTATCIVQAYDGTADNLGSFIDAATLLKDYVAADQVATAVRFLKTRLTGKARIGLSQNINTIDDLINDVKTRCEEQISPTSIIAKLNASKSKGDTNTFCDEVDKLTNKLKSVYIGQGIPDGVANSMATKVGVNALINGTTNYETKLILKAANFTNIQEAVQKVQENSTSTATSQQNASQIMTFRTQRQNNYVRNTRGRRTSHRGSNLNAPRDRYQTRYPNHHQYNHGYNRGGQYNHGYNRGGQYNNGYNRGGQYNHGYNRGGRQNRHPQQVYTTNTEEIQPMIANMSPIQQVPYQLQSPQQFMTQPQQNMNFLGRAN